MHPAGARDELSKTAAHTSSRYEGDSIVGILHIKMHLGRYEELTARRQARYRGCRTCVEG